MRPTPEQYEVECKRRFGSANPERMQVPTWLWMIESGHNPWSAREELGCPRPLESCPLPGNPDWCFDRFGKSITALADGTMVSIAGEHEDSYDPDFCIYNDVIVHRLDGRVEVFGYPRNVFPPTDFHTATLVGDRIVVIGSLGNPGARRYARAQVHALDTRTFRIEPVETAGDDPGWVFEHTARLLPSGHEIEIAGGRIAVEDSDAERLIANTSEFVLNLVSGQWRRTRDGREFAQMQFEHPDGDFFDHQKFTMRQFRPTGLHPLPMAGEEWSVRHFGFEGVRVTMKEDLTSLHVVVEGRLPNERIDVLTRAVRAELERLLGHPVAMARIT